MSGYRPPSTEPRGKWARAIHAKRRSDGISQTGAFEVLGSRLGLGPKSRAAYVAIDLGLREPTESEQRVLAEWLGGYPADMAEPGGGDTTPGLADLIARLDRQADLVTALIEQNALLMQTLGLDPLPPADVRETIREAQEQRRSASTLRPSDDPRGTGTRSRARSVG